MYPFLKLIIEIVSFIDQIKCVLIILKTKVFLEIGHCWYIGTNVASGINEYVVLMYICVENFF